MGSVSTDDFTQVVLRKLKGSVSVAFEQAASPKSSYRYLVVTCVLSEVANPRDLVQLYVRVNNTAITSGNTMLGWSAIAEVGKQHVGVFALDTTSVTGTWGVDIYPILTLKSFYEDSAVTVAVSQVGFTETLPDFAATPRVCALRPFGTYTSREECCAQCENVSCPMTAGGLFGAGDVTCFDKDAGAYDTSVCLRGAVEQRTVACEPRIPFEGQGFIADEQALATRLEALHAFYKRVHVPEYGESIWQRAATSSRKAGRSSA
jgi:hypothetical protein